MAKPHWQDLPSDAQLPYLTGLIARSAVRLDASTRNAFAALLDGGQEVAEEAAIQISDRIKKMDRLVSQSVLTVEERAVGSAALAAASEAYKLRNRYLHDDLLREDLEQEFVFMVRLDRKRGEVQEPQQRRTLTDLDQCDKDLNRAAWRVYALVKLIGVARAGTEGYERRRWVHLLVDNFDLDSDNNISWGL
jgi:hypothetical protein